MIQMINKLKKNQKGFTLVELIVVLVILAILAAFTIPAMLGFVNDAKGKALVSQTREVYMAYQATLTDVTNGEGITGTDVEFKASSAGANPSTAGNGADNKIQKSALNKLVGDVVRSDGSATVGTLKYIVKISNTKVVEVKLSDGTYTVTLTPDQTGSGSGETTTEKVDLTVTI